MCGGNPTVGSHHRGETYLYIGITSCDYKISQVSLFFNWYFIQIIQIRISNPAHLRLKQRNKLVFVKYMLSLRTSAHTGVAIPRLNGTR